jgi:hypothetical protein
MPIRAKEKTIEVSVLLQQWQVTTTQDIEKVYDDDDVWVRLSTEMQLASGLVPGHTNAKPAEVQAVL